MKKETYGNLLISIINTRLPEELCLYLRRKFKNNLWNINDLLTFLKTKLRNSKFQIVIMIDSLMAIKIINQRTLMGDLHNLCLIVAITITQIVTKERYVHFVIGTTTLLQDV